MAKRKNVTVKDRLNADIGKIVQAYKSMTKKPRHGKTATREPNVLVTIRRGVVSVDVSNNDALVELRDYDIDGVVARLLWVDESGDECRRSFVTKEGERSEL